MKKIIYILVAMVLFVATARSEDLYVGQSASGGDTGADCANQKSAAWFNTAGSWGVGADVISAGDTVHLCGIITTALVVQASGTSGSEITILFETGAKISKTACGPSGCLSTDSNSYITIDGGTDGIIESTDMGTGLGGNSADFNIGIKAGGGGNCEIKNLHVHNMYVRTSDDDILNSAETKLAYNMPIGIQFNGSNMLVHDNVLHDHGTGIQNFYDDDDTGVEIYNNDISRVGHSYALAGGNAKTTQGVFKYYNNYTHDYANWDSANCSIAHTSGIHVYGNWNGSKIFGNGVLWIYNNRMIGSGTCMTGQIFTETGIDPWTDTPDSMVSLRVFNNFLTGGPGANSGVNIMGAGGGNAEIYNNTVIGNGEAFCTGASTASTTVKIKNNYLANCSQLIYAYANTDIDENFELDYNVYATCTGFNCFWVGTVDESNFASYRADVLINEFFDINSYSNIAGDGGINSTTGRPSSQDALTVNSGIDLSSIGYSELNSDMDGVSRSDWDIGAYEYVSGTISGMSITGVSTQ